MDAMNTDLKDCVLAFLADHGLNFFLSLLNHLFNTSWMNTSINNQLLQSDPCDLSADWIKA